jgi:hypothetical protein
MIAIEQPKLNAQLYICPGLRTKYHFSCPTALLPSLFNAIQGNNNGDLRLLFIPWSMALFNCNDLIVINDIAIPDSMINDDANKLYVAVLETSTKTNAGSPGSQRKRSDFSCSIGLQTMYVHEQDRACYCMLPHSKPHVPSVCKYPSILIDSMLTTYECITQLIKKDVIDDHDPFILLQSTHPNENEQRERLLLRADLVKHLCIEGSMVQQYATANDIMFKSCTVEPTGALGFHRDLMNCGILDKTIAFLVPLQISTG